MQINLPASLFHPGLKTRGYQAPGLLRVSALGELHRRLMVIPHKQVIETGETRDGSRSVGELRSLTSVNWNGIETEFFNFWMNKENCLNFPRWRNWLSKNVGKSSSKISLPESVTSLRWTISLDICATLMTTANSHDPVAAVQIICRYWERIDKVCGFISPFKEQMEFFVEQTVGDQLRQNEIAQKAGLPPIHKPMINPNELKTFLESCYAEGKLDEFPSVKRYSPLMAELGWKLTRKGWVKAF
jgi:hypothetical protein